MQEEVRAFFYDDVAEVKRLRFRRLTMAESVVMTEMPISTVLAECNKPTPQSLYPWSKVQFRYRPPSLKPFVKVCLNELVVLKFGVGLTDPVNFFLLAW